MENRYGNKHHYVGERVATLLQGPVVMGDNEEALRKLADELESCISGLEAIGMIHELETIHVMETLSHWLSGRTLELYKN